MSTSGHRQDRETMPFFSDAGGDDTFQLSRDLGTDSPSPMSRHAYSVDHTVPKPAKRTKFRATSPDSTIVSATLSRVFRVCTPPKLLTLPQEIRYNIYNALIPKKPLTHYSINDSNDAFKLLNMSRVCRTLRQEFLPYLLDCVEFKINFEWLPRYISTFSSLFEHVRGSLVILYNSPLMQTPVNLFPLLEFAVEAPNLSLRFELPVAVESQYPFDITVCEDLNHLVHICRNNKNLAGQIKDGVLQSMELHPQKYLQNEYPRSQLNTRVQIRFRAGFKQLWMDGTHSFNELQQYLSTMGLVGFTILDVWVGVASMGARGKGLRTPAQLKEINCLLGRDQTAPSF